MSTRELVVLGTSSAVPTTRRNHNGYLLRWDGHGILFDPGEGTQRQLRHAGLSVHDIDRICLTHFHGDHCLGVPGIVQRIARDRVPHRVRAAFPAAGETYWRRLRWATPFADTDVITEQPLAGAEVHLAGTEDFTLTALPLTHRITTYGYRLAEPDRWRMLPERLAHHGITGPAIGRLARHGQVTGPTGRRVTIEQCAVPRRGHVVAVVMDTGVCANAVHLARGADLLVIEATYLTAEADLAAAYTHLTAAQAGRIAAQAGVGTLVLTHISERYGADTEDTFIAEAARAFTGTILLAHDLDRVALPTRRP